MYVSAPGPRDSRKQGTWGPVLSLGSGAHYGKSVPADWCPCTMPQLTTNRNNERTHINTGLNLNMISIYKFHHCPSLLAISGFEHTTFRPFDRESGMDGGGLGLQPGPAYNKIECKQSNVREIVDTNH